MSRLRRILSSPGMQLKTMPSPFGYFDSMWIIAFWWDFCPEKTPQFMAETFSRIWSSRFFPCAVYGGVRGFQMDDIIFRRKRCEDIWSTVLTRRHPLVVGEPKRVLVARGKKPASGGEMCVKRLSSLMAGVLLVEGPPIANKPKTYLACFC